MYPYFVLYIKILKCIYLKIVYLILEFLYLLLVHFIYYLDFLEYLLYLIKKIIENVYMNLVKFCNYFANIFSVLKFK